MVCAVPPDELELEDEELEDEELELDVEELDDELLDVELLDDELVGSSPRPLPQALNPRRRMSSAALLPGWESRFLIVSIRRALTGYFHWAERWALRQLPWRCKRVSCMTMTKNIALVWPLRFPIWQVSVLTDPSLLMYTPFL